MVSYFPREITNMIIKYALKEMIQYLKDKNYDWKRVHYEMYKEKELSFRYKYPNIYENNYLNEIWNRLHKIKKTKMSGHSHIIKLMANGKAFVIGRNNYGCLGTGDDKERNKWTEIKIDEKIVQIACGWNISIILTESGKVFGTGNNDCGQLGLGDKRNRHIWTEIKIKEKVYEIVCGYNHSMIITTDGELFVTGYNSNGQLGIGHYLSVYKWMEIIMEERVIQIAGGQYHSMLITESGKVLSTGENMDGQLGQGFISKNNIKNREWKEIETTETVVNIICGSDFSIIETIDGRKLMTNNNGQWVKNEINMDKNEELVKKLTK